MKTPEQQRAYNEQYLKENGEKIRATQRAWRASTKAERRIKSKAYREGRKELDAARTKRYHEDNPEVLLRRLCKKKGITLEQYYSYLQECGACHTKDPGTWKGKTLKSFPIDHDHVTGKVRGLLCSPCNLALGHLKDDPERCRALADYISPPNSN